MLAKAGLQDLLNREVKEENASIESSVGDYEESHQSVATGERENLQMLRNPSTASKSKKVRGIYFKVSENGSNLSAGEKQLICICRAILRKNKVVVLDEATANIDIVTEKKIQKLINEEFTSSTVITIAHRLNTIMNSDKVLVLSHGEIAEYDAP